jgi:hypothetical protein
MMDARGIANRRPARIDLAVRAIQLNSKGNAIQIDQKRESKDSVQINQFLEGLAVTAMG